MRRFTELSWSWRSTRSRVLSVATGALATVAVLASLAAPSYAGIVNFGSDTNTFAMEFKTIGNPGNANDTTGTPNPAGAVGYEYGLGKFEVSRDMITKYNANFGTANGLEITLANMSSHGGNGANKPAAGITWNEAARFVNWLNTSTGNQAAYKFTTGDINDNIELWTSGDVGYNASNPYRNSLARYVLPSYNEWYKAAFYNPNDSTYYNFANGSDTRPTAVISGTTSNTAVYRQPGEAVPTGPADVDQAGGLSPYGVMGLGGNAFEWEESSFDVSAGNYNSSGSSTRGIRGGFWYDGATSDQSSSGRLAGGPELSNIDFGFRVAMVQPVPEPSMMVIGTLFGLGGLMAKRRMKK